MLLDEEGNHCIWNGTCLTIPAQLAFLRQTHESQKRRWTVSREADCFSPLNLIPRKFSIHLCQECSALGIKGNDIATELKGLTKQLPLLLFDAASQLQAAGMRDAVDHYKDFTRHSSQGLASTSEQELLPAIREVQAAELRMPEPEEDQLDQQGAEFTAIMLDAAPHTNVISGWDKLST